jgi:L-aspartate oxidase
MSGALPSDVDLLVVGSGIAGLYAAVLASATCRVLVVTKGALEESNTRYAQGGIAVAMREGDTPALHLRDTIAAGDGLCDRDAVEVLTHHAPACIRDLVDLGVAFDLEGGELAWTLEAAHSLPRVLHVGGDATGAGIESSLAAALRSSGVRILEHTLATSLLVDAGGVTGASLLLPDETTVDVRAGYVLLATGGAGQLYARTTNPVVATGDGIALAYRAGAQLIDMEFVQFHPTAIVLPNAPSFLISEAVRGEGGILRDPDGTAFMPSYHPSAELAPRDVVARAIHHEMERLDVPSVGLDITHLAPEVVERRFPSILAFCRGHAIEPLREPIPVAPASHYLMGGIRTDSHARTSLSGLLACGEAACTGVHGANRLASNSLLEGLVFARRAVETVRTGDRSPAWFTDEQPSRSAARLDTQATLVPGARPLLQTAMWRNAGVVRSAATLSEMSDALASFTQSGSPRTAQSYQDANLALLAALVVQAATLRAESRGGHFRSDFPYHLRETFRTVLSLEVHMPVPVRSLSAAHA